MGVTVEDIDLRVSTAWQVVGTETSVRRVSDGWVVNADRDPASLMAGLDTFSFPTRRIAAEAIASVHGVEPRVRAVARIYHSDSPPFVVTRTSVGWALALDAPAPPDGETFDTLAGAVRSARRHLDSW